MSTGCKLGLFIALCYPPVGFTSVDPHDRSVSETHLDLSAPGIALVRNYHSGRRTTGVFGAGWCTLWETRLAVSTDGVDFNFCGQGKATHFAPRAGGYVSADPAYVLQNSSGKFTLTVAFRETYTFNAGGVLTSYATAGRRLDLQYEQDRISVVKAPGEQLTFRYADGKVVEATHSRGLHLKYEYEGGRLIQVSDAGQILYRYDYQDASKLLTRVTFQKQSARREYAYEGLKVVSVRNGMCVERISAGARVEVQRTCGTSSPGVRSFAYVGEGRRTHLTSTEVGPEGTRVTTWIKDRVAHTRSPTGASDFTYDNNGLLKSIKSPGSELLIQQRSGGFPQRLAWTTGSTVTPVDLTWSKGELVGFRQNQNLVTFKVKPYVFDIIGRGYQLALNKINQYTGIKGTWHGRALTPFSTTADGGLTTDQAEALGEVDNVRRFKDQVESL